MLGAMKTHFSKEHIASSEECSMKLPFPWAFTWHVYLTQLAFKKKKKKLSFRRIFDLSLALKNSKMRI